MNTPDRSSVVKVVLATLACAGAWHFLVKPESAKLAARRGELASRVADLEQGRADLAMSTQDPATTVEALKRQAAGLRALWSGTQGDSALYDSMNDMARRADVVLQRIEPSRGGTDMVRPAVASGITAESVGFTMQVSGTMDAIGQFLRLIEQETGMSRVQSARLAPAAGQPGRVEALVVTSHVVFAGGLKAFEEKATPATDAPDATTASAGEARP